MLYYMLLSSLVGLGQPVSVAHRKFYRRQTPIAFPDGLVTGSLGALEGALGVTASYDYGVVGGGTAGDGYCYAASSKWRFCCSHRGRKLLREWGDQVRQHARRRRPIS